MALLDHLVLLDHFPVLVAFELCKRVGVLSLVFGSLELAMVIVPLRRHRLDHVLLFNDDLLEGPASFHPPLQVLLDLFVSHLPPLHFFADPSGLPLYRLNLNLELITLDLTHGLQGFLHVGLALPSIF